MGVLSGPEWEPRDGAYREDSRDFQGRLVCCQASFCIPAVTSTKRATKARRCSFSRPARLPVSRRIGSRVQALQVCPIEFSTKPPSRLYDRHKLGLENTVSWTKRQTVLTLPCGLRKSHPLRTDGIVDEVVLGTSCWIEYEQTASSAGYGGWHFELDRLVSAPTWV